jgi:hypothetical protein
MTGFFRVEGSRGGGSVVTSEGEGEGAGSLALSSGGSAWWRRRSSNASQVREVSLRMLELATALEEHFRKQDESAVDLARSLDRVGSVLEQLSETQEAQRDYLQRIAEHTENAGRQSHVLNETLARVPEALLTQAEAIRGVARQLDLCQESDTQLMHSLQQFGRAVDTLSSSGAAQVDVLKQMNEAQRQQHDSVAVLVREQGRRFLLVVAISLAVALVGLAALIASLAAGMGG